MTAINQGYQLHPTDPLKRFRRVVRKYVRDDIHTIRQLRRKGWTVRELAMLYQTSTDYIIRLATKLDPNDYPDTPSHFPAPPQHTADLVPEDEARLIYATAGRMTVTDLADETGYAPATIREIIRRYAKRS